MRYIYSSCGGLLIRAFSPHFDPPSWDGQKSCRHLEIHIFDTPHIQEIHAHVPKCAHVHACACSALDFGTNGLRMFCYPE